MAHYILSILQTQVMVALSWGFHSAFAIKDGLSFYVDGYLHKGKVEVTYDEGWDLFSVRTFNPDGSIKQVKDGVYADGLVEAIDTMVEKTDDYSERVKRDYFIS